ncbi:MAB_1171c family putative transporter [Nocardia sp. NPDC057030]|uniref:MAB_1171c family putative transporter n=1 Tax=unclassified Nocardia TaxID=2637762 RepID=UPI003630FA2B
MVTSSWPTTWSLPLIGYAWILVILRLSSFRATFLDRHANLVFVSFTVASTMREPTTQQWIVELCAGRVSGASLFQFAMILMGAALGFNVMAVATVTGRSYRPVIVHGIAVAGALSALYFGTGARAHGVLIEEETGWAPLGFWLSMLPMVGFLDYLIIQVSVAELRRRSEPREVLAYAAFTLFPLVHLVGYGSAPVATIFLIRGEHNVFTAMLAAADRDILLYQTALFAIGMTVPMLFRLAAPLGLDSASRSRKRLLPLWSDLTAACPEIVYHDPTPELGSRFLLHRTVIEIRDCLRILSRYIPGTVSLTGDTDTVRDYAIQLAHACVAKSAGAEASAETLTLPSTAGDVSAETAELTALAMHWNDARTIANLPLRTQADQPLRGINGWRGR